MKLVAVVFLILITLFMPSFLHSETAPKKVVLHFSAKGITKVILRAGRADQAKIVFSNNKDSLTLSGVPVGGTKGYHSPDPSWKETPASEWGLSFIAKQFGDTLIVSTQNEMQYIHHSYLLKDIEMTVPKGIEAVKQVRTLNGEGAPDLSAP